MVECKPGFHRYGDQRRLGNRHLQPDDPVALVLPSRQRNAQPLGKRRRVWLKSLWFGNDAAEWISRCRNGFHIPPPSIAASDSKPHLACQPV